LQKEKKLHQIEGNDSQLPPDTINQEKTKGKATIVNKDIFLSSFIISYNLWANDLPM
jgi:hypothetical protein